MLLPASESGATPILIQTMKKIFLWTYDHAPTSLGVLFIVTLISTILAFRVSIDVSQDSLMPRHSEARIEYEKIKETFGSDVVASIYVRDPNLFSHDKLVKLQQLHDRISSLPGVERVESLFSVTNIKDVDGFVEVAPLLDWVPEEAAELKQKQADAIRNPMLRKNFISLDGNSTIITAFLDKDTSDLAFEQQIHKELEEALAPLRKDFKTLYQIGSPFVSSSMADYLLKDQILLVPLSMLIMILMIGLSLNSMHCALVPIIDAALSTAWTICIMQAIGLPINLLTYAIPALTIVIGSTEDTHILSEFIDQLHKGKNVREAVGNVGDHLGITVIVTAFTTSFGFFSTSFTNIPILQSFGYAAAMAMLFNFCTTIFFIPAYLRMFGPSIAKKHRPTAETDRNDSATTPPLARRISEAVAHFIIHTLLRKPATLIITTVILIIPCLYFASFIVINNDLLSFFRQDSPIVTRLNDVQQNLVGSRVFYVTIKGDPGDFTNAQKLKKVESLQKYLRSLGKFDSVMSVTDLLSLTNREMHEGKEEFFRVPGKDDLLQQYLMLFRRYDYERYLSHDASTVNLEIHHNINSSTELNALVAKILKEVDSGAFGPLNCTITGKDILVAASVDGIAICQTYNLTSNLALILIIISSLFLSLKAGGLAIIPNLVPIFVIFGVMGFCDIPLSIGTCMVAAVTIGIAVDDTIHFMIRYNKEMKTLGNEQAALEATIRSEVLPVLSTSVSLMAGFLVLGFSSFVPVAQFGILSGTVMIFAVVADLVITPLILSRTRLITLWDAIGLEYRENLVHNSPVLKGLTRWQSRRLILLSRLEEHPEGHTVIREGEAGGEMFLVVDGKLDVHVNRDGKPVEIAQLEPGSLFGEMALISKDPRTATVTATTPVKLLSLNWKQLEDLRIYSPFLSSRLYLNFARILGQRLASYVEKSHD